MGKVRSTVIVDEDVWKEFRDYILSKYGSLRGLSRGVQEALESCNSLTMINSFSRALGLEAKYFPSSREIEEGRPKSPISAGEIVRKMRDERGNSISGFQ